MKFKTNFQYKASNFQMEDCRIERVVELSREDFCRLKITPLDDQPFIMENKDCMFKKDGIMHCLLALEQGGNDGVLIDAEGYNYPRYASYVPGMRDIVNALLDRAAALIIRDGAEKSMSANWCVSFGELEEQLGLTIREGNGLDSMLQVMLERRPEVAAADMRDGCIELEYHPEYCRRLKEEELPGLRLKELLPLLKGGPIFLCHEEAEQSALAENLRLLTGAGQEDHAALFNARVSEINETPEGTEVVLTDVAPEELVRFNEAYDAFMEAEQAMGPTMG